MYSVKMLDPCISWYILLISVASSSSLIILSTTWLIKSMPKPLMVWILCSRLTFQYRSCRSWWCGSVSLSDFFLAWHKLKISSQTDNCASQNAKLLKQHNTYERYMHAIQAQFTHKSVNNSIKSTPKIQKKTLKMDLKTSNNIYSLILKYFATYSGGERTV